MNSLAHLSLTALDQELRNSKRREQVVIGEVVKYLAEVDSRRAYLELGYSSLFTYCTTGLGYSEGAAQRRIQAARMLASHPEVTEKLQSGALSLCAVAEVAKVKDVGDRAKLLLKAEGKSKEAVARLAAEYQAPQPARREIVRARDVEVSALPLLANPSATVTVAEKTSETRFTITVEVDAECMELLTKAQAIAGVPVKAEVLKRALKEYVGRDSSEERLKRRKAGAERSKAGKNSPVVEPSVEPKRPVVTRHVPVAVRDMIYVKDGGRCSYVSNESGHRCAETRGLEIDHCRPWGLGGDHSPDNLRLLCPAHNKWVAVGAYGDATMRRFIKRDCR